MKKKEKIVETEAKEICNIQYSRKLVENAIKTIMQLPSSKEYSDEQHENFRKSTLLFFKKYGNECECKECSEFAHYLVKLIINNIFSDIENQFEIKIMEVILNVGHTTLNLKRVEKQPPQG